MMYLELGFLKSLSMVLVLIFPSIEVMSVFKMDEKLSCVRFEFVKKFIAMV